MTEKKVTNENKEVAKYITTITGINRTVQRYWDEEKKNFLDIFTCDDPIDEKVVLYFVINISAR